MKLHEAKSPVQTSAIKPASDSIVLDKRVFMDGVIGGIYDIESHQPDDDATIFRATGSSIEDGMSFVGFATINVDGEVVCVSLAEFETLRLPEVTLYRQGAVGSQVYSDKPDPMNDLFRGGL